MNADSPAIYALSQPAASRPLPKSSRLAASALDYSEAPESPADWVAAGAAPVPPALACAVGLVAFSAPLPASRELVGCGVGCGVCTAVAAHKRLLTIFHIQYILFDTRTSSWNLYVHSVFCEKFCVLLWFLPNENSVFCHPSFKTGK